MIHKAISFATFIVGISIFSAQTQSSDLNDAITKRIAPTAAICQKDSECPGAPKADVVATAADTSSGPRSGEAVYESKCKMCHASGLMSAPKLGSASDWEPRLAQGIDTVLSNAINGKGGMPPRGTCVDCSDEEIQAAIDHMTAGL